MEIGGVRVRFHWSLYALLLLLTFSLAEGLFKAPLRRQGTELSTLERWLCALSTSILFLACIALHEIAHVAVSSKYGVKIRAVHLWLFGGIAQLEGEINRPYQEFLIAIAGPVTSAAIGGIAIGIAYLSADSTPAVTIAAMWLGIINIALAVFNLLPAYPLDGGRVLKSLIWACTGSKFKATVYAAMGGKLFAIALIVFGIFSFFFTKGGFLVGFWYFFLGLFLYGAAQAETFQAQLAETCAEKTAADVMSPFVVSVPASENVLDFIERYSRVYGHKAYPVVDFESQRVLGVVSGARALLVPFATRPRLSVKAIMTPLQACVIVSPTTPLMEAIAQYGRFPDGGGGGEGSGIFAFGSAVADPSAQSRMLVIDSRGRLRGIIAFEDIARYIEAIRYGKVSFDASQLAAVAAEGSQDKAFHGAVWMPSVPVGRGDAGRAAAVTPTPLLDGSVEGKTGREPASYGSMMPV